MIKLGTHSGTFHADESLAVYLLRLLPAYSTATLVRTRDPVLLATCDVLLDVGGHYDPTTHRYDHHQRGFNSTFQHGFITKLSSAGLVYKHFGTSILSTLLNLPLDHPTIKTLYPKIYQDFIEALDGIDNGIPALPGVPLYRSKTDLSSRISSLNPRWNEPSNDKILDQKFLIASELAGKEFRERVDYTAKAWLPARELVSKGVQGRGEVHESGKVVLFEEFSPWKEHLHLLELELEIPADKLPLYVLYPDESGKWRIQAVPISADSFESRKALPEAWRGIRDEALDQITGIPGCIFVHAGGFIGGNATKEGALKMAIAALAL